MKIKVLLGIFIVAILLFRVNSFAGRSSLGSNFAYYPAPELWYPVTQDIDLTGEAVLQFKWRRVDQTKTDHYIFKLYKGYNMLETNLILKENIAPDQYPFKLPKETFEVGQVYTWSLRQVYLNGAKTDIASSPFKIIKK
jgi:hypothetical protein